MCVCVCVCVYESLYCTHESNMIFKLTIILKNYQFKKECFDYSCPSAFPYSFLNQFFNLHMQTRTRTHTHTHTRTHSPGVFDRDCIESVDKLGRNCHVYNNESSNTWNINSIY